MLQIKTENGVVLDLFPDTKIDLELLNPMFNEIGSHSMGFDLPASPKNLKELGFSNFVETLSWKNDITVFVLFMNHVILKPRMVIKGYENKIRAYFADDEGDFYYSIKDKLIKDHEYEANEYSSSDYNTLLINSFGSSYPDFNFVVYPVRNEKFYEGTPKDDATYNWTQRNMYQNYYLWYASSYFTFLTYYNMLITPFPYLCYVLKILANQNGYNLNDEFFVRDNELRTINIYNANAARRNDAHSATGSHTYQHDLGNHLPEITIAEFIKSIENNFNVTFFVNNTTREITIKANEKILTNIASKDITTRVANIVEIEDAREDGVYWKYEADGADDWFNYLIKDIYDSGVQIADSVDSDATLATITTDPANTVRLVEDVDQWRIYMVNESTFALYWNQYSRNIQGKKTGNGNFSIETLASPLVLRAIDDDLQGAFWGLIGRQWATPQVEIAGNDPSAFSGMVNRDFGLRLMFYRGLREDSNGDDYPFASADIYDEDDVAIPGATKSLHFWGDAGLYKNYFEKWFYWLTNVRKKRTFYYAMNHVELGNMDWSEKYRISGTNHLLSKITLSLYIDHIGVAKVEAYTV